VNAMPSSAPRQERARSCHFTVTGAGRKLASQPEADVRDKIGTKVVDYAGPTLPGNPWQREYSLVMIIFQCDIKNSPPLRGMGTPSYIQDSREGGRRRPAWPRIAPRAFWFIML
jgi:hypothetical protein